MDQVKFSHARRQEVEDHVDQVTPCWCDLNDENKLEPNAAQIQDVLSKNSSVVLWWVERLT